MKKILIILSTIFLLFLIVTTLITVYMDGEENPDEQFNGKFHFSRILPAKQYPGNFNECVEYWRMPDKQANPEYLEVADKQEKCQWHSNRKIYPILLHCPAYGKVVEQKMCGDFECSHPTYECYLEFINPNYAPPDNYENCLIQEWNDQQRCKRFLE